MIELRVLDDISQNPEIKEEIINISNQIIQQVNPESIYLFGSVVKQDMNDNSDLDWMVVIGNKNTNQRKISQSLYKNVKRSKFPCDFIVTNSDQLEKQKSNLGLIYYYILKEGRRIYVR